jgi:hypothetical protein
VRGRAAWAVLFLWLVPAIPSWASRNFPLSDCGVNFDAYSACVALAEDVAVFHETKEVMGLETVGLSRHRYIEGIFLLENNRAGSGNLNRTISGVSA